MAAAVGWDGIEVALRAGGHILPERVDEDLPRLVEALRARGQQILVLATDIVGADPLSEKVLRAAARADIRLYRMGYFRYREGMSVARQLDEIRPQLAELAALNRQLGVTGLLQNHSGNGYVGSAIWDLYSLIEHIDPRQIGVHFDIGHATVEGGLSWPTNFALVKDRIGAVIVKDFAWKLTPGRGGTARVVPHRQRHGPAALLPDAEGLRVSGSDHDAVRISVRERHSGRAHARVRSRQRPVAGVVEGLVKLTRAVLLTGVLALTAAAPPWLAAVQNLRGRAAPPSPWADFVEPNFPFFSSVLDARTPARPTISRPAG